VEIAGSLVGEKTVEKFLGFGHCSPRAHEGKKMGGRKGGGGGGRLDPRPKAPLVTCSHVACHQWGDVEHVPCHPIGDVTYVPYH
jgi:hypothetical protein